MTFRVLPYQGGTPREISEIVNNIMDGKTNNTGTVTLATGNATSTTLNDAPISIETKIVLIPFSSAAFDDTAPHGQFICTNGQTAAAINTAYALGYNTTTFSSGITVVDNTPKPTTATYVTNEKITAAGEYKLSKVLTGIKDQAGKALFIDTVTGTDVQTKATTGGVAQGTKVGTVEAKSSTTGFGATFAASIGLNGSGDSVIFINGANPVAGQKGNVVVIVRNLAGDPVATFDLEINIP
jgi:hypothetical protein